MANIVICPYCERELKILRKDGELRNTIYCKCKTKKYKCHNSVLWCPGLGYQSFDEEMNLIDVLTK